MTPHSPKRVMLFDHTAQLGGGEIALLDMVRFLDRSKVTPIVVLGSNGPLADRLRGIAEVHILELTPKVLQARKDTLGAASLLQLKSVVHAAAYVLQISDFIRTNEIALIHTNSLKADILGGIAGRLARTPVIWHIRDRISDDYLPKPVVRLVRMLCRVLPDYVIGNSAATLETLKLNGAKPNIAIGSGVDLVAFHESGDSSMPDPGNSPRKALIGLVGRICPWKGQHIFLRAAAEVHKQFPHARFQMIGAALFEEQDYEIELREMAKDLGIAHAVEFTGFRSDVPDLMRNLDILVHASTTGEPFGQVIVQGMAAGKAVVATNGGGVPEIVVHGETGLLVPMRDAPALASAMCTLLNSPELAAKMGRAGRRRVLEHFTIEQTARKIETVYAELAARA